MKSPVFHSFPQYVPQLCVRWLGALSIIIKWSCAFLTAKCGFSVLHPQLWLDFSALSGSDRSAWIRKPFLVVRSVPLHGQSDYLRHVLQMLPAVFSPSFESVWTGRTRCGFIYSVLPHSSRTQCTVHTSSVWSVIISKVFEDAKYFLYQFVSVISCNDTTDFINNKEQSRQRVELFTEQSTNITEEKQIRTHSDSPQNLDLMMVCNGTLLSCAPISAYLVCFLHPVKNQYSCLNNNYLKSKIHL